MNQPFTISTVLSIGCHLVFAMTAGAYFLNQEPEPPKEEVRVTLVEKKKPDRKEIKEKKIQKKLEIVPVMKPLEVSQPVTPQRVQMASAQVTRTDFQPVNMEQVKPTVSAPLAAPVNSNISSRAMTAAASSPRPMRSVAVATTTRGGSTIAPRTTNVQAFAAPTPNAVSRAPVVVNRGSNRVTVKTGNTRIASVNTSVPLTPTPVIEEPKAAPPAPPAPKPAVVASAPPTPKVVDIAPEISTDEEALNGYKSGLHRRLTYVAQKYYKRSSARRANQQGKVMLAFTVTRDGSIKNAHVKQPSKFAMLNQTALDALKQAAPFTEFPEGIVEPELNMVIPFSFTLR